MVQVQKILYVTILVLLSVNLASCMHLKFHHFKDKLQHVRHDIEDGVHHVEHELKKEVHKVEDNPAMQHIRDGLKDLTHHLEDTIKEHLHGLRHGLLKQVVEEVRHVDWEHLLLEVVKENSFGPVVKAIEDAVEDILGPTIAEGTGIGAEIVSTGLHTVEDVVGNVLNPEDENDAQDWTSAGAQLRDAVLEALGGAMGDENTDSVEQNRQ